MRYRYPFVLIILLVISGCARTSVTMMDYTERTPTEHIRIFTERGSIDQEFIEIALINSEGGAFASADKIMQSMIKKAREIGADGIIVTSQESKGDMFTGSTRAASGIAIKFDD